MRSYHFFDILALLLAYTFIAYSPFRFVYDTSIFTFSFVRCVVLRMCFPEYTYVDIIALHANKFHSILYSVYFQMHEMAHADWFNVLESNLRLRFFIRKILRMQCTSKFQSYLSMRAVVCLPFWLLSPFLCLTITFVSLFLALIFQMLTSMLWWEWILAIGNQHKWQPNLRINKFWIIKYRCYGNGVLMSVLHAFAKCFVCMLNQCNAHILCAISEIREMPIIFHLN